MIDKDTEVRRSENRANRAGDTGLASVEEPLTARSPGRGQGRISDGLAAVAITLHPAKALQQLESDLQQDAKCH